MEKLTSVLVNGIESAAPEGEKLPGARVIQTERLPIRYSCELKPDKTVDFRAAVYADENGVDAGCSVLDCVDGGLLDDRMLQGAKIFGTSPGFSALIANGGEYLVDGCRIALLSQSNGKGVCDFVGLGAAVAAFREAEVYVNNSELLTGGVAKCAFFADEGASVVATNCRVRVRGGELYEGYVSNADFNYMVAPPWVLGIKGSARAANLMGRKSSMAFIDCDISASDWGVLSTDNGDGMALTVADCTLTLTKPDPANPYRGVFGSGYGSYILCADEQFYGVAIRAGTYIGIARDGNATYQSSNKIIRHVSPASGKLLYEGRGKGQRSCLYSDAFGIMTQGFASLRFLEQTLMRTREACFLLRSGGVDIQVRDGSELHSDSGILLQLIDDDDRLVGVDWGADIEMKFLTDFYEKEGWPSENGQISSLLPPPPKPPLMPMEDPDNPHPEPQFDVHFTASDTVLNGDLLNGSGYYGQPAKQLYVCLEHGAVLNGRVSATETIHVDENGRQNTHFTAEEYYYLGRVKNRNFYNGDNHTEVTLQSGSVWNVSGESLLSALTIEEDAVFNGRLWNQGKEIQPEAGKKYCGDLSINKI